MAAANAPQVARGPALPFPIQQTSAGQTATRPQPMGGNAMNQHPQGQPAGAQANLMRPPQQQGLPPGQSAARPPGAQPNNMEKIINMSDAQIIAVMQSKGHPPEQQRAMLAR